MWITTNKLTSTLSSSSPAVRLSVFLGSKHKATFEELTKTKKKKKNGKYQRRQQQKNANKRFERQQKSNLTFFYYPSQTAEKNRFLICFFFLTFCIVTNNKRCTQSHLTKTSTKYIDNIDSITLDQTAVSIDCLHFFDKSITWVAGHLNLSFYLKIDLHK